MYSIDPVVAGDDLRLSAVHTCMLLGTFNGGCCHGFRLAQYVDVWEDPYTVDSETCISVVLPRYRSWCRGSVEAT